MSLLFLVIAAVMTAYVPVAIRRLPEPAPEVAPEGDEVETELQRMLREEGPKELYTSVGSTPRLGRFLVICTLLLCSCTLPLGSHPVTWVIELLAPVLLLLAVVDLRTRLLPRLVVLPATGVLLVLVLIEWAVTHHTHVLIRSLVAMLVARSCFWVLWFVRRAGMGFGDVRLAALIGLVLGRVGWNEFIVGLYGGLLAFSIFGIGLMAVRRDRTTLRKAFPYGPFMIGGLYLGLVTSGAITLV